MTHHLAAVPLDHTVSLRAFRERQHLLDLKESEKLSDDLVHEMRTPIGAHCAETSVACHHTQQAMRRNDCSCCFHCEQFTVVGRHAHAVAYVRISHIVLGERTDEIDPQLLEHLERRNR